MKGKLLAGAALIGLGLAWYLVRGELSLDQVVERERQLRGLTQAQPWQTFAIGFLLYVIVSVFPGTGGKSIAAGWLFGFWPACLMVVGALTLAGAIGFSIARYFFRDVLREFFGVRLTRFDRTLEREGAFYLLTLRLLHVPFTFVNYLSGVSIVGLRTFIWTTSVGLVPGTVVLVGLGAGLPSLNELLEQGAVSLIRPGLLAALFAMALIPWIVRGLLRRRYRTGAGNGDLEGGAAAPGGSE